MAVSVNHIPYNEALDIKSKDPDILLFKGEKGDKGDPGKDGVDGKDGKDGRDGKDGEQGPQGEKGDPGKDGKDGKDGEQGPQGEKGDKGDPGKDGFSPVATVTQTQSGATVSITDKNGTTTANISNGADGQDYVLTTQDKTNIANIDLGELPTTQGVLYGNASN